MHDGQSCASLSCSSSVSCITQYKYSPCVISFARFSLGSTPNARKTRHFSRSYPSCRSASRSSSCPCVQHDGSSSAQSAKYFPIHCPIRSAESRRITSAPLENSLSPFFRAARAKIHAFSHSPSVCSSACAMRSASACACKSSYAEISQSSAPFSRAARCAPPSIRNNLLVIVPFPRADLPQP